MDDIFEEVPLIKTNKILETIQVNKKCIIHNNDVYLSHRKKKYLRFKIILVTTILVSIIIVTTSTILMIPNFYTPFSSLFIGYNKSLNDLYTSQTEVKGDCNYLEKKYSSYFTDIYNDPQWNKYSCSQFWTCYCDTTYDDGYYYYGVIDFNMVIIYYDSLLDNIWCDLDVINYGDTGIDACKSMYRAGVQIENSNVIIRNIATEYWNARDQYKTNLSKILDLQKLINDGKGIIHTNIVVIFGVITSVSLTIIFLLLLIGFLKQRQINRSDEIFINDERYQTFLQQITNNENGAPFKRKDVDRIIDELSIAEDKRALKERRMFAFLSASKDRNSTPHSFLGKCGKDLKKMIYDYTDL